MFSIFSLFRRLKIFPNLSRELSEQYLSVLIRNLGVGLIRLFEPVYIYKIFGEEIKWTALYYIAVYLIRFFFIPLAGKIVARFGFEKTMSLSLPLQIIYLYLLTFAINYHYLFFILPFLSACSLALYWISYHTNFAHYGDDKVRGGQYSGLNFINDIFAILSPVIGGIVLYFFGFQVLFIIASLVIMLSCVPMLSTKEKFTPSKFSYFKTFRRLLTSYKTYKHNYFLAYLGYGVDVISKTFWLIFVAIMLKDNFSLMGILNGAIALLIAAYSVYIGHAYDKCSFDRNKSSYFTALIIYAVSWPLRIFAIGWWQILLIKVVTGLSGRGLDIGIVPAMYRRAGIYGNLKYVTFFSQSMNLGRIILLSLVLLWDVYFEANWQTIFLLGGVWSILMGTVWRGENKGNT
jgi:MFS family permease